MNHGFPYNRPFRLRSRLSKVSWFINNVTYIIYYPLLLPLAGSYTYQRLPVPLSRLEYYNCESFNIPEEWTWSIVFVKLCINCLETILTCRQHRGCFAHGGGWNIFRGSSWGLPDLVLHCIWSQFSILRWFH